jgi:hypothetical protein
MRQDLHHQKDEILALSSPYRVRVELRPYETMYFIRGHIYLSALTPTDFEHLTMLLKNQNFI